MAGQSSYMCKRTWQQKTKQNQETQVKRDLYLEVKLHYNSYTEIMQMIHYLLRREDDHDT